jgi:hypothetical protein
MVQYVELCALTPLVEKLDSNRDKEKSHYCPRNRPVNLYLGIESGVFLSQFDRRSFLVRFFTTFSLSSLPGWANAASQPQTSHVAPIRVTTVFDSKRPERRNYSSLDEFWQNHEDQMHSIWFKVINSQLRGQLIEKRLSPQTGQAVYIRSYSSINAYHRHLKFLSLCKGFNINKVDDTKWVVESPYCTGTDSIQTG